MNLVTIWNRTVREFNFNDDHDLGDDLFNMKGDKIKDLVKMAYSCNASAKMDTWVEKPG